MNEKSTTHKAEGLERQKLKAEIPKAEMAGPTTQQSRSIQTIDGEQAFLQSLMRFTRSAKRSRLREVAKAARDWEGVIDFRIRMTMQERNRRQQRRTLKIIVSTLPRASRTNAAKIISRGRLVCSTSTLDTRKRASAASIIPGVSPMFLRVERNEA